MKIDADRFRVRPGERVRLKQCQTRVKPFHASRAESAERLARHVEERKCWKDYMRAYEACLQATSTKRSPWCVVPADDKANARPIVSRIAVDTPNKLDMAYPRPDAGRRRELRTLRKLLAK